MREIEAGRLKGKDRMKEIMDDAGERREHVYCDNGLRNCDGVLRCKNARRQWNFVEPFPMAVY
jgi:hypothetical protein